MVKIDKQELLDIVEHLESIEVPYKCIKTIHKYFLDKIDESAYTDEREVVKCRLGLVPPVDLFDGKH